MVSTCEHLFGQKPSRRVLSPLDSKDHPELDTSKFLDLTGTQQYQSLVSALQWAVSFGHIDIMMAVMMMSSFRAQPHCGHMDHVKHICGYLFQMSQAAICFCVNEPDYLALLEMQYDWSKSVYGKVKELVPDDAPTPLGKRVILTHYFDANLLQCMLTGHSYQGSLHFYNQTPIDWHSKKQVTVETATYGSEYTAGHTTIDQAVDHHLYLHYLGVPSFDIGVP